MRKPSSCLIDRLPGRLPSLAGMLLLATLAGGCGAGGGGSAAPAGPGVAEPCPPASSPSGSACTPWAKRLVERAPTPFLESGTPVTLEVVIYEPLAPGPHATVVFHHGSTGDGDDPSLFRLTRVNEPLAHFFTARGWSVAFPQRRGRGASGGTYDEGFEPDRSRYSCRAAFALPGVDRALADADAGLDHVRRRAGTDASRVLVAGHSRGGILAIAQAARRLDAVRGALNFAGGWLGEACVDAVPVNRATFLRDLRVALPTLWIYGERDPFYSVAHARDHFDAYVAAGGQAEFRVFSRAGTANGHFVIDDPLLWQADVAAFLARHFGS